MASGALWVPLDPEDPPARVSAILKHSGVELVLTSDSLRHRIAEEATPVLCTADVGSALSESNGAAAAPEPVTRIDTAACLLYSAHAHRLRAAKVSHRTLAALIASVTDGVGLTDDDVALAINPTSLDASVVELLAPLAVGAVIVIADADIGRDADELAGTIAGAAATLVIAPTSLWADLLVTTAVSWTRLKAICVGELPSDGTASALLSRTAGAWLAHGFPEAGIWSTLGRLRDSQPAALLGRPLRHVAVKILESGSGEAPVGIAGDLHVGVEVVPRADAEASDAEDGVSPRVQMSDAFWFRTGERARWRTDGTLELIAGRDRETSVAGFRVDLEDLSSVLRHELPVRDAAASFRAAGDDHRPLVAYFSPLEGVSLTTTELREQLHRVLPERLVPRSFIEVETIVRTADGALEMERPGTDLTSADDYMAPASATEILLAELWESALSVPRVSVHDNFFELGGYSLLCFQVLERLERKTGHRLSPRLLLLDSLGQVAAQLDAISDPADDRRTPKAPKTPPPRAGFFRKFGRFLPGAV
jgi:acyl-CoA synthetase (AMP-forming)/AMP-acid ligase II